MRQALQRRISARKVSYLSGAKVQAVERNLAVLEVSGEVADCRPWPSSSLCNDATNLLDSLHPDRIEFAQLSNCDDVG